MKKFASIMVLNVLMSQLTFAVSDLDIYTSFTLTSLGITFLGPAEATKNVLMSLNHRAKEAVIAASQEAYAYSQKPSEEIPAVLSNAIAIINSACQEEDKALLQQLNVQQQALIVASIADQLKKME